MIKSLLSNKILNINNKFNDYMRQKTIKDVIFYNLAFPIGTKKIIKTEYDLIKFKSKQDWRLWLHENHK